MNIMGNKHRPYKRALSKTSSLFCSLPPPIVTNSYKKSSQCHTLECSKYQFQNLVLKCNGN